MNFNQSPGPRSALGLGRKTKRISDVNAVGPPVPTSQYMSSFQQPGNIIPPQYSSSNTYPNLNDIASTQNYDYSEQQVGGGTQYTNFGKIEYRNQPEHINNVTTDSAQLAMFQQPIVQDMAMQYGQKLADQGKQLVETHVEKWISVTRLKYYFAVDNKYVINKLRLLFFPYTHKDWSLKYDQESPVQPRYDINAPDLYVPTMAYITYVVVAGLMLGMQNRFSPEQLGMQASSALAYITFELVIYSVTLYIANIPTSLRILDLLAFSGYKFVIIVFCIIISMIFKKSGYYISLLYCSLSLGFFLLRTLKAKVLHDPAQSQNPGSTGADIYGTQGFHYTVGRKRKLYFLFLVAACQALLSLWLTIHLISNESAILKE